jgi:CBS domain-containing protein
MHVSAVLKRKGQSVVSLGPEETIAAAATLLTTERIGAVLVLAEQQTLLGILSERDIVHGLAKHGDGVTRLKVADLMTRDPVTCRPSDSMSDIMEVMTQRRIRHLPVVENASLVGIISIGDVVKQRLDEVASEVEQMREYVTGAIEPRA